MKIKSKKGFSLLEILLVLGIIASLIVAAFIVYPKIQSSQRAEMEAKNISTIISGVRTLYAGKQNFTGLNNTVAINAGIIPISMIPDESSSSTIVNQFKGNVRLYVSSFGIGGVPNSSFTLIYSDVPAEECVKMLTTVTGDMGGVSINSGRVKEIGEPLNRVNVTRYCYEGGNNNTINMTSY